MSAPADAILDELRRRWPDAYHCHPTDKHRWLATCPACGAALVVHELGRRGGPVALHCAGGCTQRDVLAALAAAEGDPEHLAELAAQTAIAEADEQREQRAARARGEVSTWAD
jgi:hypothetical protein